jgi:RNA polymerase sigma factor (sigma-70 family)
MSALFEATRVVDFDRLYRRHAPSVYRYTYAVLGNHADAEDVTQQTFLNAYRACAQGTKPRKAENWLLRIAHNEVRRHFRQTQRKPREVELDQEVAQPPAERSDPSLADVLRALHRLPPSQRSALVMREFEGRSYAEIADIMGVSQSALEALTFRARRALAEQLEDAFTCDEAEEAVLRRLDGRLPRRLARRLKVHLHDCRACVRFADVQKRQRAVLRGLSVLPIPASLFLFRAPHGAAAGGAAAAGSAGVATGVIAKAAAVTAAAAVAGGVGYGVAAGPEAAARVDRNSAPAPAVAARAAGRLPTAIGSLRFAGAPSRPQAVVRAAGKRHLAKAPRDKAPVGAATLSEPEAGGKGRWKQPRGHKGQRGEPAAGRLERNPSRDRPRPTVGKKVGGQNATRPQLTKPKRTEKPRPSRGARPTPPPKSRAKDEPKRGGDKPKPTTSPPSGRTDSEEPADPGTAAEDPGRNRGRAGADTA